MVLLAALPLDPVQTNTHCSCVYVQLLTPGFQKHLRRGQCLYTSLIFLLRLVFLRWFFRISAFRSLCLLGFSVQVSKAGSALTYSWAARAQRVTHCQSSHFLLTLGGIGSTLVNSQFSALLPEEAGWRGHTPLYWYELRKWLWGTLLLICQDGCFLQIKASRSYQQINTSLPGRNPQAAQLPKGNCSEGNRQTNFFQN